MTPLSSLAGDRRSGFTLIELLTVIAIIGILASILIPVVSKVRESARWSQGLSNLRQVTMANLNWANDHNGVLLGYEHRQQVVYPRGGGREWWTLLANYVNSAPVDLQLDGPAHSPILRDPSARNASPDSVFQFSFMRHLTVSSDSTRMTRFTNIHNHVEPSGQILAADAGLGSSGHPHGDLHTVDGGWWTYSGVWGGNLANSGNDPITPGNSEPGNIRWTGGRAKFGFMDGHVKTLSQDMVLRRMVNPLYQAL
ncbi:MAG: type II secretion system protein [Puniceicoccaceae bacterium]|nr:MAG: type II secretion system protein [Puniceicoccaceae bacterium]